MTVPTDRPDWSTSGTATGTVVALTVSESMPTTRSAETFTLVTPPATKQVELHSTFLQYRTTSTTAVVELLALPATDLFVWYPRKMLTAFGSHLVFDFEGAVLPKGAALGLKVTTNFAHGALLQVNVNYVLR